MCEKVRKGMKKHDNKRKQKMQNEKAVEMLPIMTGFTKHPNDSNTVTIQAISTHKKSKKSIDSATTSAQELHHQTLNNTES